METPADAWMFSRLAKAVKMVTEGIESYTFGDMARGVQQFFWNEVCDWYVEVTKARLKGEDRLQAQRNLIFVLDTSIRLMHPLMPFVTEEIWDNMPASVLDLDAEATWTAPSAHDRPSGPSPPTTLSMSMSLPSARLSCAVPSFPPPAPRVRVIA